MSGGAGILLQGGQGNVIEGDLIGINVALRQGAEGLGFTIPSKRVREVMAKHIPK